MITSLRNSTRVFATLPEYTPSDTAPAAPELIPIASPVTTLVPRVVLPAMNWLAIAVKLRPERSRLTSLRRPARAATRIPSSVSAPSSRLTPALISLLLYSLARYTTTVSSRILRVSVALSNSTAKAIEPSRRAARSSSPRSISIAMGTTLSSLTRSSLMGAIRLSTSDVRPLFATKFARLPTRLTTPVSGAARTTST